MLSHLPPIYNGFDIKINHQRLHTTHSHTSLFHHCNFYHYCNIDFVLFHIVACYTISLLSHIHVNTKKCLNITFLLVATSMILRSLGCNSSKEANRAYGGLPRCMFPKEFCGSKM